MPFDSIQIDLSLEKIYENGVQLLFDFYKLDRDGKKQKLAFGEKNLLCAQRDEEGKPIQQKFRINF